MSIDGPQRAEIERFVRKHKVAVAIGGIVLLLALASEREEQPAPAAGIAQPMGMQPMGAAGAGAGDAGGTIDMDEWRRRGAADDRLQRERVDSIREVQRCTDPDTGETREVSIHAGC